MYEYNFTGCRVQIYDIYEDNYVEAVLTEKIGDNLYVYSINASLLPIAVLDENDQAFVSYSQNYFLDLLEDDFEWICQPAHFQKLSIQSLKQETKFFIGSPTGQKRDKAIELGWSFMETPELFRNWSLGVPFAMDNGVFAKFIRGEDFDGKLFLQRLDTLFAAKICPEFVVIPDVVGNWLQSKERSLEWLEILLERYGQFFNYAFVLQEGCTAIEIESLLLRHKRLISHIFIGGKSNFNGFGAKKRTSDTPEWKWQFAEIISPIAKKYGIKIHIGRASSLQKVNLASAIGADSVDTSQPNFSPKEFNRFEKGVKQCSRQRSLNIFNA